MLRRGGEKLTSLVVEPIDILLFRDGKPFSAGSDHLARSVFPPYPGTLAGFIRSKLLQDADLDWEKAKERFGNLGSPNDYGDFRVTGYFLRKEEDYVPLPADLVRGKTSGKYYMLQPLTSADAPALVSNLPEVTPGFDRNVDSDLGQGDAVANHSRRLHHLWVRTAEPVESTRGFISLKNLFDYLLVGQVPPSDSILCESKFAVREARTIVGISKASLTSDPGRLANVEFVRMLDGTSFHVRFEGLRWPGKVGLGTLGGEGRTVRWRVLERWEPPKPARVIETVKASRRFKIVLLTPAIFEAGWVPGKRLQEFFHGKGAKVRLVAAIVNRPVHVGGFDLHRGAPKPMFAAAPAGSVYYYEIDKGDVSDLVNSLQMNCISDRDWEAGMGLSVVGGWEYA